LCDFALIQDYQSVVVNHRVYPVGYGNQQRVVEFFADGLLNFPVSFKVDRRRGFIENNYRALAEKRTRHRNQLALAMGEIGTLGGNHRVERDPGLGSISVTLETPEADATSPSVSSSATGDSLVEVLWD